MCICSSLPSSFTLALVTTLFLNYCTLLHPCTPLHPHTSTPPQLQMYTCSSPPHSRPCTGHNSLPQISHHSKMCTCSFATPSFTLVHPPSPHLNCSSTPNVHLFLSFILFHPCICHVHKEFTYLLFSSITSLPFLFSCLPPEHFPPSIIGVHAPIGQHCTASTSTKPHY